MTSGVVSKKRQQDSRTAGDTAQDQQAECQEFAIDVGTGHRLRTIRIRIQAESEAAFNLRVPQPKVGPDHPPADEQQPAGYPDGRLEPIDLPEPAKQWAALHRLHGWMLRLTRGPSYSVALLGRSRPSRSGVCVRAHSGVSFRIWAEPIFPKLRKI